jgi:hypothetical protein
MLSPMKLMMASELTSTGELEISRFQRLSLAKGRNPLRLAPCPVLMALQALWLLPPEPEPDPPLPEPEPDPDPELVAPDENVEAVPPPPQFAHESTSASTASAASPFFHKNCMALFSQEIAAKSVCSQPCPVEFGTCTISIWPKSGVVSDDQAGIMPGFSLCWVESPGLRLSQKLVFVDHRGDGDFAIAIVYAYDFTLAAHADAFGQRDFGRKG